MPAIAVKLLRQYNTALHRHPLATQVLTTGALWGLGDVLAQRLEKRGRFNARRGLLAAAFGAAAAAPFGHFFYTNLETAATSLYKPGTAQFVAFKVAADALIYEPLYCLGYFALMTLGSGGSLADVRRKLQHDFWPTLLAELTVWPPIQAANFKLVASPSHQLLIVNLLTVIDSAFMSMCCSTEGWLHAWLPLGKKTAARQGHI